MKWMVLCAGLWAMQAAGQVAAPAVESFRFEMDGSELKQPSWILVLHGDGSGFYWGPEAVRSVDGARLQVSAETWKRVRGGVAAVEEKRCETKLPNIAKTGVKDVEYQDGKTDATCSFNYSDDAGLNEATAVFEAIAETMQEGEKLQHDLRFDRLGLDAEMDFLMGEVRAGRAIEVPNISGVLRAIVGDERVMERVRRKAGMLVDGVVVAR